MFWAQQNKDATIESISIEISNVNTFYEITYHLHCGQHYRHTVHIELRWAETIWTFNKAQFTINNINNNIIN